MAKDKCLIVRAAGRQLDELRSEASRIAKGAHVDWWVERAENGICFGFADAEARNSFARACENIGVQHREI